VGVVIGKAASVTWTGVAASIARWSTPFDQVGRLIGRFLTRALHGMLRQGAVVQGRPAATVALVAAPSMGPVLRVESLTVASVEGLPASKTDREGP
jgi:hypothetical protein